MSNLKKSFQTHLFSDLQPIVQQQESLQLQNNLFQKSMSELENSFIQSKHSFQTENQNLHFSDHTHFQNQKDMHLSAFQSRTASIGLFKDHPLPLSSGHPQTMDTQEFKNSSKLQDQLSSDKSFIPTYENLSISDQHSSFNDQDLSTGMVRGSRKKIIPDNLTLSHSDHMMLGGKVISGLEKNIVSLPFREPVDVERFNIPDYLEIVKQPMDLRTIKRKIYNDEYQEVNQIYADIELIISNSLKYNEFNPDFIRLTKNFQKSYFKIRRDCERNIRKLKIEEEKRIESFSGDKMLRKPFKPIENNFPSNQVEIISSFQFSQLTKLAKKIRKLQAYEQIQLFKKIGIFDTMVIDIKTLSTKQVRLLMKEVEKIEKAKEELIRNEQKKENSHNTTCDNEYKCAI